MGVGFEMFAPPRTLIAQLLTWSREDYRNGTAARSSLQGAKVAPTNRLCSCAPQSAIGVHNGGGVEFDLILFD